MTYTVHLETFEGPLDLLLALVRENKVDIRDIPIARITDQYLTSLRLLQERNIDLAGEFLVMAATLMHIKSRMLLPVPEDAEQGSEDPRADLARRLLEHERFIEAGRLLDGQPLRGRDIFVRGSPARGSETDEPEIEMHDLDLFHLAAAYYRLVTHLGTPAPTYDVALDRLRIQETMTAIRAALEPAGVLSFQHLVRGIAARRDILVTFLALLELMRLKIVAVLQRDLFGPIRIMLSGRPRGGQEGGGGGF